MPIDLQVELAAIKMVDKARGDLFAVILPDRSLIVQAVETMHDAESTRDVGVPGYFAVTKNKPEELWIRTHRYGIFTQCRFPGSFPPSCPNCAWTLEVADEKFVCEECGFTT